MNKQFIQVTHGLLPVAVLLLLAVAFVAAQARANLSGQPGIDNHRMAEHRPAAANIERNGQLALPLQLLPDDLTTFATMPAEIDLTRMLPGKATKSAGASDRPAFSH